MALSARKNLKKRPYSTRKKISRKNAKPSKALKKAVESIMSKKIEDKTGYKEEAVTYYNGQINQSNEIKFLMPDVGQGSQEGNRIGDQIAARRLVINGLINLELSYSTARPACRIGVRIFMVQPKLYNDRASITANANSWLPYLLRKGNVAAPFNGSVPDLFAPVNSEVVTTFYDKVIYLSMPYMASAVGQQETAFSFKHFKHALKVNSKKLLYDSNYQAGQQPTNYSPCILMGYAHVDGSTADSQNSQVGLQFNSWFDYEDA